MPRKITSLEAVATIGIDIGKNTYHIISLDKMGAIVLRRKWSRGQVEARLSNMPPCLIGMEARVGAHHLSRKLKAFGHDARLMPAKYVRPYSKGQKNDFRDAEAIRRGGAAPHDEVRGHKDGRSARSAGLTPCVRLAPYTVFAYKICAAGKNHMPRLGFAGPRRWNGRCASCSGRL
jgi:hypothetical protein